MQTAYDWVTLAIFAGLLVLFLQRSSSDTPRDTLGPYLIAGVGCAVVNYIGNQGMHLFAIIGLVALLAFIQWALRPIGAGTS